MPNMRRPLVEQVQRACRSGIISVSVLHARAVSVEPIEIPKQIAAWLVLDS